ncbi:MAG TPA: glycoside hydrolase family 3 C-terminal domain-containing protein [Polyangiaceae bacterium]|jgi:beta-glucosidase|nr:glycoside hydrolase family 3 C-terminal domain-containing protein [Polyangiaceae bacterium]
MTDWGAQNDTVKDANAGLDQETGVRARGDYQWLDKLAAAIEHGQVPEARLNDMVRRIARSLLELGAIDSPVTPAAIDFAEHAKVTRADAEEGIVLLQNDGVLPLAASLKRVAVIGGHADAGVLTGGGSAQVYAPGGNAVRGLGPAHWPGPQVYARSSPLTALRAELPNTSFTWADGSELAAAARTAAAAEVAIVFVTQWTAEARDFSLSLPDGQDQLVEAVVRANPRTVVVLETGGPVLLPWAARVAALVEAWYPGSEGGPAIARVLSGVVNPSGHLPASFPRALSQLPRPEIPGAGLAKDQHFDVSYSEGAAVGYRWYDQRKLDPLFAFGHGESYTTFVQSELTARVVAEELQVAFRVQNTGTRAGRHVAQIYVSPRSGGWEAPKRLGAFTKLELAPGASSQASVQVDPRLLAVFDVARNAWHIAPGDYTVTLANSARDTGQSVNVRLAERWLPAGAGAAQLR